MVYFLKFMIFCFCRNLVIILGMVISGKLIFRSESWLSRKYMGVWSLEFVVIRKSRVVLFSRLMMNTVVMRKNKIRWGFV